MRQIQKSRLRLCLGLNRKSIWILGGTGNRIDHLWANVQCLQIALDAGADARILDSHNQIRLIDKDITLKKSEAFGPYFLTVSAGNAGG